MSPGSSVMVGAGAARFLAVNRSATVAGVFRNGCYLRSEERIDGRDDVMAVVGPSVTAGPLNLVLPAPFPVPPEGSACRIDSALWWDGPTVRLEGSRAYTPTLPTEVDRFQLLRNLRVCWPSDLTDRCSAVERHVATGNLSAIRDLVCGRGRGLTPEGDDVLAGLVIVRASNPARRPMLAELVDGAETGRLSRAYLHWAANGHGVTEVHELLWAASSGDRNRFLTAVERVGDIGGSTGSAMLAGMTLAARWPDHHTVGDRSAEFVSVDDSVGRPGQLRHPGQPAAGDESPPEGPR